MINNGLFTSLKDDRATPLDLYNELDNEFHFTLDTCANDQNFKNKNYYTKEQNGLIQNWDHNICWCNPPYGKEISLWVKKASQIKNGIVVMLLPARTDTKRFHDYIYNKSELRFIKGRLKFSGCSNSAPFPSMIVIFRN